MQIISEEKMRELQDAVLKSNGKAFVLVHPHYNTEADKIYWTTLRKILMQTKTPVIILEQENQVHEMRGFLFACKAKTFILPTEPSSENLLYLNGKETPLSKILNQAGVRRIYLGGQLTKSAAATDSKNAKRIVEYEKKVGLRKSAKPMGKNPKMELAIIGGCVGGTYKNLVNDGMNVRLLSNTLHPERPQYWKARRK
jgi:hypothetical protein